MLQLSHNTQYAEIATGRNQSLLAEDVTQKNAEISDAIIGKRLLIIGGAGSIGGATIDVLSRFKPACMHIIDQNENGLADLVRHLRSRSEGLPVDDFATLPLDFGNAVFERFLRSQPNYDVVMNFAAIKHVRSEKDAFSTLQMFETNIVKQARFMRLLAQTGFDGRMFVVSTDKAANPSSMMGASKRALEHVIFSSEAAPGFAGKVTSARFANVAFSNGSLLQAFEQRLRLGQALSVPQDTRRYFVSIRGIR